MSNKRGDFLDKFKSPIRLINIISNRLKRGADENLMSENVTVEQVMVMKMISERGGKVKQKEIENEFKIRRSTVTSAMQILEKKGYILRESDPLDSRAKTVLLTEAGKEKNLRLFSFIKERDEKVLGVLTSEEKETLNALLIKLLNNIE